MSPHFLDVCSIFPQPTTNSYDVTSQARSIAFLNNNKPDLFVFITIAETGDLLSKYALGILET